MAAKRALDLSRLDILVVEDNKDMQRLLKQVLLALGVRKVQLAADGADGLSEMQTFTPDIVFCDWLMAPVDGLEFTRHVRTANDSPNPYAPIILLTAHTELRRVREARDMGVNEVMTKPISAESVYRRMAHIIEKPRQFVRCRNYFGPDRRRKAEDPPGGTERRDQSQEYVYLGDEAPN